LRNITIDYSLQLLGMIISYVTIFNVWGYIFIIYGLFCRRFDGTGDGCEEDMLWPRDSERCPGTFALVLKVRSDIPSLDLFGEGRHMIGIFGVIFTRCKWPSMICVCPTRSLVGMTSDFLGRSVPYGCVFFEFHEVLCKMISSLSATWW